MSRAPQQLHADAGAKPGIDAIRALRAVLRVVFAAAWVARARRAQRSTTSGRRLAQAARCDASAPTNKE
jgi:hypothetical protein